MTGSSHWKLLESFSLSSTIQIDSYRSELTGLRVVHASVPGPLVMGYFTLSTEAHSDDGCPHTLEHLVFMGSEQYPYKGVLDLVANRNLSQGTNAWTDIDHTCYTLETAGQQGFLALLPVYLDHILYPTMKDSAFLTEVHHITGDGKNAGVVYCEMQARENTDDDIMTRAVHTALYPGHCGYKSETGGLMKDIRTVTAETIRQYHRDYYRPDNLSICIVGMVSKDALFETLAKTEEVIVAHGPLPELPRPWTTPVPAFDKSVDQSIVYPSEDEDVGTVVIGWRACNWEEFDTRTALEIMWAYLIDTTVSPLHQAMIEIEHPYCSDVDANVLEKTAGIHMVSFEACPIERIDEVKEAFYNLIHSIVDSNKVDLDRMHVVIDKVIRQTLSGYEDQPHPIVANVAISNFMYGTQTWKENQDARDLEREMKAVDRLKVLITKPASFWVSLMKEYILDRPAATIIGRPSHAESKRLMDEEAQRVQAQIEQLKAERGPNVLADLQKQLDEATALNSITTPQSVIDSFTCPDLTQVQEHPLFTHRSVDVTDAMHQQNSTHPNSKQLQAIVDAQPSLTTLPFAVQFDHIPSAFVQFRALFDTELLPVELKPLLPLYRELVFESPMVIDGVALSSKEVVNQLEKDFVHYESNQGISSSRFSAGAFSQFLSIALKCDSASYDKGIRWLYHLLNSIDFSVDRIVVALKRMLSSIPELKNDGSSVVKAAMATLNFDDTSVSYAVNFMRQQSHLKNLLHEIHPSSKHKDGDHPMDGQSNDHEKAAQALINQLKQVQALLADPASIRLHVACDFTLHQDTLVSSIAKYFTGPFHQPSKPVYLSHHARPLNDEQNVVLSVAACESSYLSCTYPLQHAMSYSHEDIAALRVALEYLTTLEGPLWRRIRGLGYSYSYSIRLDIEAALVQLVLFKSTNLGGAYNEAESIVTEFVTGAVQWRESELISARSSLGFELLASADTITAAADNSLMNWLKQQQPGYNRSVLAKIQHITVDDLQRVLIKYIAPVFSAAHSRLAVSTNPTNVKDIVDALSSKGRKVHPVADNRMWFQTGDVNAKSAEEEEEDSDDDDDESGSDYSDEDETGSD